MIRFKILNLSIIGFGILLVFSVVRLADARGGGVIYSKPIATGAGDCSNWQNACTLQTALGYATTGDEIWVAAGTHKPTSGSDRTATFQLENDVQIYGGFIATETLRTQRNWLENETILSGDIGTQATSSDNVYHVVNGSDVTQTAVLDGFTITGGNADSTLSPNTDGGGIYIYNGSPTLVNITIKENFARNNGGGMYNFWGSPSLTNMKFLGNHITIGDGGGMFIDYSNAALYDVTFENNSGGMLIYSGNPTLENVTFYNNSHSDSGGGLSLVNSSPVLTNTTFYSNSSASVGGAICINNSSPIFYQTTVVYNASSLPGSGIYVMEGGTPQIHNSILWGNTLVKMPASTATISLTYSVVQNGCPSGFSCTNLITTNPILGSLKDNGGNTHTMALLHGSSALEAVPLGVNGCGTTITIDQRGVTRPQGTACDAGAFEAVPVEEKLIYLPLVIRE